MSLWKEKIGAQGEIVSKDAYTEKRPAGTQWGAAVYKPRRDASGDMKPASCQAWISSLQNCEKINFSCLSHLAPWGVILCYDYSSKLIQVKQTDLNAETKAGKMSGEDWSLFAMQRNTELAGKHQKLGERAVQYRKQMLWVFWHLTLAVSLLML
jgi:hypothetical protein